MDKYKLEKLRAEYEYRKMAFESELSGDRITFNFSNGMREWVEEAQNEYFAALDEMSQKEGARGMKPKIIQILFTPESWNENLIGLSDDGKVYEVRDGGRWVPYIPEIEYEYQQEPRKE